MWNTRLVIMITFILLPLLHLTYYDHKHFTLLRSDLELICLDMIIKLFLDAFLPCRYFVCMCPAKYYVTRIEGYVDILTPYH